MVDDQTKKLHELKNFYKQRANIDGLTELYNHTFFLKRLTEEMNRSKRECYPLSLMMIDVDFFKKVNDSYGHTVGDQVLIRIANTIKEHIRSSDIGSRYGGEEFAVLMPSTSIEKASEVAGRLLESVAEIVFTDSGDKTFSITVSIGLAQWDCRSDATEFTHRADSQLYLAKDSGRNCIRAEHLSD